MDRTRVSPTIDPAPPDAPACRNCGVELTGPYCARCGQEDVPLDRSLWQILRDGLEDLAALDSRLVRTLLTLLFRPGRLTVDYNEGRRIRYVPPLRLYMVASVVFFFTLTIMPGLGDLEVATPDDAAAAGRGLEPSSGAEGPDDAVGGASGDPATGDATSSADSGFEAWLEAQAWRAASDPAGFVHFWIRVLAWSMFVLLPVAALMLMAVYRRPKRYYVQHLVFTLHVHTFAFVVLAAALAIDVFVLASDAAEPSSTPILVASGIILLYIYLALKRSYGEGRLRTMAKLFVLGWAYMFAQSLVIGASAFVALGLF